MSSFMQKIKGSQNPFRDYSDEKLIKEYERLAEKGVKLGKELNKLQEESARLIKEIEQGQRLFDLINEECNRRNL